ncbi:hypothetical protein K435DRAFT_843579, partial [Dendrothele bispora CBS 962.96]
MEGINASTLNGFRLYNCFHLMAIVILYYDHLLSLDQEINLLWKKTPWKKSSILFFINRYVSFLGNIALTVLLLHPSLSDTVCQKLWVCHNMLYSFTQSFVGVLLSQRVYGMYGCSNRIFRFLVGFTIVMIGAASFAAFYPGDRVSYFSSLQGCHVLLHHTSTLQIASAWEVVFVYDLVLFSLTLYKAHTTVHDNMDFVGALGRRSLMQVLISDGSLYFVVVALSNMTNILSFYDFQVSLKGGLSTFAGCISVTMMSRLVLNLQAANRGTEWDSFSWHSLHFARPPGSF